MSKTCFFFFFGFASVFNHISLFFFSSCFSHKLFKMTPVVYGVIQASSRSTVPFLRHSEHNSAMFTTDFCSVFKILLFLFSFSYKE